MQINFLEKFKRKDNTVIDMTIRDDVRVKYHGRGRSGLGTMAIGVGVVGWLVFAFLIHQVRHGGYAPSRGAMLALCDAVLAVFGLVLSGRGLRENNVYYLAALIGAVLNGFLLITYIVLFLMGVALS